MSFWMLDEIKIMMLLMLLMIVIPVDEFSADTALEEAAATVARQYAVMFSARRVSAHETGEAR